MGMTPRFLSQIWEIEEKYIQDLIEEGAIPIDGRGEIPCDLHNLKELDEAIGRWDEAKSDPVRAEVQKKIASFRGFPASLGRSSPIVEDSGEFFSEAGKKAFQKAQGAGQIRILEKSGGKPINYQEGEISSREEWEKEGFASPEGMKAFKEAMARGCVRIFSH